MKFLRSYVLLLVVLSVLLFIAPDHSIDPWELVNPHKLIRLIFTLTLLQILGALLMNFFKGSVGGGAYGFFGGLISSTALTVSLAKQSQSGDEDDVRLLSLSYLSALFGMILEGVILVYVGLSEIHWEIFWAFSGPILATLFLLFVRVRSLQRINFDDSSVPVVHPASILKLGVLIAVFLALSKILQYQLGTSGQFLLTFVTCLIEMHGSIIGNVQLHESNILSIKILGHLIAVGIVASYLAKWALVMFVGSPGFKRRASKYTGILLGAHLVGWALFSFIVP
ncbi:MAG: DUF4010 domain-containing protein [Bacillota bacterium]